MKRFLTICCVVLVVTVFASVAGAKTIAISVETSLGDAWALADAVLSSDQSKVGGQSLYIPRWGAATYKFSEDNVYGTATIWVYDLGLTPLSRREILTGPRWGIMNKDGEVFAIHLTWSPSISGNFYSYSATTDNLWRNRWTTNIRRSPGWHKFTITTDGQAVTVSMDDALKAVLDPAVTSTFKDGFNSVYFYGGDAANLSGVYIDDIQIDIK